MLVNKALFKVIDENVFDPIGPSSQLRSGKKQSRKTISDEVAKRSNSLKKFVGRIFFGRNIQNMEEIER